MIRLPIDVGQRGSPGWWLDRQFRMLSNPRRRRRLQLLHDWQSGEAPLPDGVEPARQSFRAFMRMSRTNFARLLVAAVAERMIPVGFRTAADSDETGDPEGRLLWERAGMDVRCTDLHALMLGLSEAYVIVGEVDDETGVPTITAEDPRWMVGDPDPMIPWRLRAALKVRHDDVDDEDRAYLYRPGRVFVARRPNRFRDVADIGWWDHRGRFSNGPQIHFDPRGWEWHPDLGGEQGQPLRHDRMPVVRFQNQDGLGEFEPHLDLLTRINQVILQRMVVTTLQAFRQRAISGLPNVYPEGHEKAGQEIDYTDIFSMDPAALWQLPETATVWESGQADLSPILSAIKDDVQQLAAVSETPMHMLMPAGENQSAEGAAMLKEGLVFRAGRHITRASHAWAWVMSLAFEQMGDTRRADLSRLRVLWRRPSLLSMQERGDAASKAQDVPWRSRMLHIWEFTPEQVDQMATERADELLLEAQIAAATAAAGGQAAVQPTGFPSGRPAGESRPVEPAVPVETGR